ncbi:MAG: ribosome-associated translation inhibitor RaiA [Blastocatellia bacterium]|nr:ribosome-associated translation inhibitor RaiA [Blastocatellia bacterium]
MKYEFTGRHITVTPALRKHTREHLDKLDRILDSAPMSAHVILDVEKHRQNAEIVLTWRDHTFKSNSSTKDITTRSLRPRRRSRSSSSSSRTDSRRASGLPFRRASRPRPPSQSRRRRRTGRGSSVRAAIGSNR